MTTDVVQTHVPAGCSRSLCDSAREHGVGTVLALLVGLTIGRFDHRDDPIAGALLGHVLLTSGCHISQNFNTVWFAYEQLFEGSLFNFHAMRLLLDHPNKPIWRSPGRFR